MNRPLMAWDPPSFSVQVQPAGLWWDAVRVPLSVGERALELLGASSRCVIEDRYGRLLYWLVKPGAASAWEPVRQVEALGDHCYVAIPPVRRTRGDVRWLCEGEPGQYLTDAGPLYAALTQAAREVYGPGQ